MNIDIFGVTIARLHSDYTVFYLAILAGILAWLLTWRQLNHIQKDVYELVKPNIDIFREYMKRMELAKDPSILNEKEGEQ